MLISTEGDNIRGDNVALLLHVHIHCYCIMVISTKGDNIRDDKVPFLLKHSLEIEFGPGQFS